MDQIALDKPPHLIWTITEMRFVFELLSFQFKRPRLKKNLPKGDGHAVMVIPGFLGNDKSTVFLRKMLTDLNYEAHGWGLGQNRAFNKERVEELGGQLKSRYESSGRKVTLVGWSLGGIFAREVAKLYPEWVRSVITLGSPVSGNVSHTFAYRIYTNINGIPTVKDFDSLRAVSSLPPVPSTSIYSKSDGIVAWRNSIQEETEISENIRVRASHCGLGSNPKVMAILANRIAQPTPNWTKYAQQ